MLRNHVDRAYSHFMMERKRKTEPLKFEEAIKIESERILEEANKLQSKPKYKSIIHQQLSYLARGDYFTS